MLLLSRGTLRITVWCVWRFYLRWYITLSIRRGRTADSCGVDLWGIASEEINQTLRKVFQQCTRLFRNRHDGSRWFVILVCTGGSEVVCECSGQKVDTALAHAKALKLCLRRHGIKLYFRLVSKASILVSAVLPCLGTPWAGSGVKPELSHCPHRLGPNRPQTPGRRARGRWAG